MECSPANAGNNADRVGSGMVRPAFTRSESASPCSDVKRSFQWLEERIDTEVRERRRLWSSLMEDLGKSQATVKRLEEKFEDMQRMLQGQTGCVNKVEGNPELGARFDALDERIERLSTHYGTLEAQIWTLQMCVEQSNKAPAQLETQLSGFTAQLKEEQRANERRNQQLHTKISELQAQTLVKDSCSVLEDRWKVEIARLKRSEESLAEQFRELHERSESRCSTLEARVGGICVPELIASTADRLHKRMNTLQQALMERRSNGDLRDREPSPLIVGRGRRNSC